MGRWDWAGIPANVLLFLPFGFALGAGLDRRIQGAKLVALVTILGGGASAAVELLQLSLPTRTTSLLDLVTNAAGAALGGICFHWWSGPVLDRLEQSAKRLSERLSARSAGMAYAVYALAGMSLCLAIYPWTGRSTWTWDPDYPLMLGNEANGERAWKGKLWRVELADSAVAPEEARRVYAEGLAPIVGDAFLGSYSFSEEASGAVSSRVLPQLRWRGSGPAVVRQGAVMLPGTAWLQSVGPAKLLTDRIRRTNQFTLAVLCEPASRLQFGPARIVSLSLDSSERNFTLGQFGDHVAFRLRAPLTGLNGTDPELHLFNVFQQLRPVHLLITYDGARMRAWVNGERSDAEVDVRVRPGAALLSRMLFVSPYRVAHYDALFSVLLFVPLGLLAGVFAGRLRGGRRVAPILAGVILPGLLFEAGVCLLLGLRVAGGTILLDILLVAAGASAGLVLAGDLARLAGPLQQPE